jgi:hypothetical protein
MSDERRKRQEARTKSGQPRPPIPLKYLVIGAIVGVVGLALFLGWHRHNSKLNTFAQCLGQKQAKMYGAFWCPHCSEQKELFGSSFQYAPYTECGIQGSRGLAQVCTDAGIKRFPTWVFSDGSRTEGEKSLEYLSDKTGCPLP